MLRLRIAWTSAVIASLSTSLPTPSARAEGGATGRRVAVIVGVEDYEDPNNFGRLNYAADDAGELAEVLKDRGFEARNVRVLLGTKGPGAVGQPGGRADRSTIMEAIQGAIGEANRPEDSLILAFSGHGLELFDEETRRFGSYFCPVDSKYRKDRADYDRDSMVDLEALFERLRDCRAGMKLMLVDACQYRAIGAKAPAPLSGPSRSRWDYLEKPRNTVAFFGCQAGMQSFEAEGLKHGLFMHCVIKAFRGEPEALDEAGDVTHIRASNVTSSTRFPGSARPIACPTRGRRCTTATRIPGRSSSPSIAIGTC